MSWEASELWVVDVEIFDRGPSPLAFMTTIPKRIAGDRDAVSVGEPVWFNSTALVFTSDVSGHNIPWIHDLDMSMGKPLIRTIEPYGNDFSEPAFQRECSTGRYTRDMC